MIEIIAEIGVNHDGSVQKALELVAAAKGAGANTVKTQLWNTERVYPRERWDEMKRLELTHGEIEQVKRFTESLGMNFLCTPDDILDACFLRYDLGCERIKTSSMDVTNLGMLKQIGKLGCDVVFSTGACDWNELRAAFNALWLDTRCNVTPLHCVSAYPAKLHDMNLKMVRNLANAFFGSAVGLSDHTRSNEAAIMSLALGATVFEKHLTMSVMDVGPDHLTSLDPVEFFDYAWTLRQCEQGMGDGEKFVLPCEADNRRKYDELIKRKKLHAHGVEVSDRDALPISAASGDRTQRS